MNSQVRLQSWFTRITSRIFDTENQEYNEDHSQSDLHSKVGTSTNRAPQSVKLHPPWYSQIFFFEILSHFRSNNATCSNMFLNCQFHNSSNLAPLLNFSLEPKMWYQYISSLGVPHAVHDPPFVLMGNLLALWDKLGPKFTLPLPITSSG